MQHRIPLLRAASLHPLRRGSFLLRQGCGEHVRFVRALLRYYQRVRLLHASSHWLRLIAFPLMPQARPLEANMETSRFPRRERLCMPGSSTTPDHVQPCDDGQTRVAFCYNNSIGIRIWGFRRSMAGLHHPLSTLHPMPRGIECMTRGQRGSLLLRRSGLSPPTPCRSPGALLCPRNSRRRGRPAGSVVGENPAPISRDGGMRYAFPPYACFSTRPATASSIATIAGSRFSGAVMRAWSSTV